MVVSVGNISNILFYLVILELGMNLFAKAIGAASLLLASSFVCAFDDPQIAEGVGTAETKLTGTVVLNLTPKFDDDGKLIGLTNGGPVSNLDLGISISPVIDIGLREKYTVGGEPTDWTNITAWNNPTYLLNTVGAFVEPVVDFKTGDYVGAIKGLIKIPDALENTGPTEFSYPIDIGPDIKINSSTSGDAANLLDVSFIVNAGFRFDATLESGADVNMNQAAVLQFLKVENEAILSGNAGMVVKDTLTNKGTINNLQGTASRFNNFDIGIANINNNFTVTTGLENERKASILVDGGKLNLTTDAYAHNSGQILITNSGALILHSDSTLKGSGTIKLDDHGIIQSNGFTFSNTAINSEGGVISGKGILANHNHFSIKGELATTISSEANLLNNTTITQVGNSDLAFDSYKHINNHVESKSVVVNSNDAIYEIKGDGDLVRGTYTEQSNGCGTTWYPKTCTSKKANKGTGEFNNEGTFVKSAGDGETVIQSGITFNNTGAVEIQSGTLTINKANGSGGLYTVKENTVLNINGGDRDNNSYSYANNTSGVIRGNDYNASYFVGSNSQIEVGTGVDESADFTGEGKLIINGINGSSETNTSLKGDIREVVITGNLLADKDANISIDFDNTVELAGGAVGGNGEVINNSDMAWKSGDITGEGFVNRSDKFELTGQGNKAIRYTGILTNEGIITQHGDSDLAFNSYNHRHKRLDYRGAVNNEIDAVYDIKGDGDLVKGIHRQQSNGCGNIWNPRTCSKDHEGKGTGEFNNKGMFVKSEGDGESIVEAGITFNNTGTVEVQSGTLHFEGDLSTEGTVIVHENAKIIKDKNFIQSGGQVAVNGELETNAYFNNGGVLRGSGNIYGDVSVSSQIFATSSEENLTIFGDFSLLSSGDFFYQSMYGEGFNNDGITVSGKATIDDFAIFTFAFSGYDTFFAGDYFNLIVAESVYINLDNVVLNVFGVDQPFDYELSIWNDTALRLTVLNDLIPAPNSNEVPEPSWVFILGAGLLFYSRSTFGRS